MANLSNSECDLAAIRNWRLLLKESLNLDHSWLAAKPGGQRPDPSSLWS